MASPSRLTEEEFMQVLREGMPSAVAVPFEVLTLERGRAVIRRVATSDDVRPGGTVAGPVLFGLADLAMYAAVLSAVGKVPMAVTTDATIHFLRWPRAGALVARAQLLKQGRRLVVGEVTIAHEGEDDALVHAVLTYALPPGA